VSEPLAYLDRTERRDFLRTFGRVAACVATAFAVSHALGLRYLPSALALAFGGAVFLALPHLERAVGHRACGHVIGATITGLVTFVASLRGDLPVGALVFLCLVPLAVEYLSGVWAAAGWAAAGVAVTATFLWRVETGRATTIEALTRPEVLAQKNALEAASVVGLLVLLTSLSIGLERRRRRVERLRTGKLSARIRRLSASVAHELNNPLAWMSSTSAFLNRTLSVGRTPQLDQELVECSSELVDGTRRLVQFSEDLRALGAATDAPSCGDPRRVLRLVKSLAGVAPAVALPDDLPPIAAPEGALAEVLVELLLSAGLQPPTLSLSRTEDEVIFTVTRAEGLEPDAVTEALMQGLARVSTNANSVELRVRVASG